MARDKVPTGCSFLYFNLHRRGKTKDSKWKCSKHSLNLICPYIVVYLVMVGDREAQFI
jgi:hypothetical protein